MQKTSHQMFLLLILIGLAISTKTGTHMTPMSDEFVQANTSSAAQTNVRSEHLYNFTPHRQTNSITPQELMNRYKSYAERYLAKHRFQRMSKARVGIPKNQFPDPVRKLLALSPLDSKSTPIEGTGFAKKTLLVKHTSFAYPKIIIDQLKVDDAGVVQNQTLPQIYVAEHVVGSLTQGINGADMLKFLKVNPEIKIQQTHFDNRIYQISFELQSLDDRKAIVKKIESSGLFSIVENNPLIFPAALPDDPYVLNQVTSNYQYHLNHIDPNFDIGAKIAWDYQTDCSTTKIAILDSGVKTNHPELVASIDTINSQSFVPNEPTYEDMNGHGTHVAGIIGAAGNNAIGVSGVCWQSSLTILKVMDGSGFGTMLWFAEALNHIATNLPETRVINASLGGAERLSAVEEAITTSTKGRLLIVAVGNASQDITQTPVYPASFPGEAIIRVAASDEIDALAGFSNYGNNPDSTFPSVDIAAPGNQILSTFFSGVTPSISFQNGTSMAAPMVTGTLALLWSYNPTATPKQIRSYLLGGATEQVRLANAVSHNRRLNIGASMMLSQVPTSNLESQLAALPELQAGSLLTLNLEFSDTRSITSVSVYNGDELLSETSERPFEIRFLLPNTINAGGLRFIIVDSNGLEYTRNFGQELTINQGPTGSMEIISPKPYYFIGEEISLSGGFDDADGVSHVLYKNEFIETPPILTAPYEGVLSFPEAGTFMVQALAVDGKGATNMPNPIEVEIRDYPAFSKLIERLKSPEGPHDCQVNYKYSEEKSYTIEQFKVGSYNDCTIFCNTLGPSLLTSLNWLTCGIADQELREFKAEI